MSSHALGSPASGADLALSASAMRTTTVAVVVALVLMSASHAFTSPASAWHLSDYWLTLMGKVLCYAIVAVAMDFIWGLAGILSLGHGLFFALGGYAFGMYLMRQIGHDGSYHADLPDFMVFLDWTRLPWFWQGSEHFWWAVLLALALPAALAGAFGYFAFRSRIRGVYFSIITQALTYASMLLFFRNETGFGGNNGFTDFKRLLDLPITSSGMRASLFLLSGLALLGTWWLTDWLRQRRFGRVLMAIRDAESRVMFMGYAPGAYKLMAWMISAALCGLAGALYVPQVGIINPGEMSPANSIEIAIWVAVGGRGSLVGPILGALLVNGAKTVFTSYFPDYWLFFLGALFVATTLYLPDGVWGRLQALRQLRQSAARESLT